MTALSPVQRELLARMSAPPGEREGLFPTTAGQRGLWFLEQLTPGHSTYHMPTVMWLRGELDLAALARSFDDVVNAHESLRTSVVAVDGTPMQWVRATATVPLAVVDGLTAEQALEQAQRSAHEPFDLAAGPLVRAVVWRVAPREHLLLLVAHHIIADGWSLQVLLEELAAEQPAAVPGLEPADLALRAPTDPGAGLEFWTGLVAGATPAALPDRSVLEPDAPPATPRCGHCRVALEEPAGVAALARGLGATAYAVQLAALAVALHAFTRDSAIVGVPFAGRDDPRTHRTVGMLVNTMPVRVDVRPAQTPEELVTRVAALLREAMRHRDVPFAALAGSAGARSAGQLPYLDVVLGTEPELPTLDRLGTAHVELVPVPATSPKFPLTVTIDPDAVRVEFDRHRFGDRFAASVAHTVAAALLAFARTPRTPVGRLALVAPPAPGPRVTTVDWLPASGGLGAMVGEHAAATPSHVAVIEGERRLTYGQLVASADLLAARLRRQGCDQSTPVAVYLPRGADQITACLGIVRAGSFYLPVDPDHPPARVAATFADARPSVVVTTPRYADQLTGLGVTVLLVPAPGEPGEPAPASATRPDDLAMLIYTSGSTGVPKGIGITHAGIAHLVAHQPLGMAPDRTYLHLSSVTFDASTWEIWSTLLAGNRGVVLGARDYTAAGIGAAIREHAVTTALLTTQLFHAVVDEDVTALAPLRELYFGGEAASADHVRRAARALPRTRLFNAYGPAENTVIATLHPVSTLADGAALVPVGTPLPATQVYLLDRALRRVPEGAVGEIVIGGPGLARGYLGRPGLTAQRFVPSPFVAGERLYRTGDLARRMADGTLQFLGRDDRQVKIRGHRIEPAEVEARLQAHPQVSRAVVVAHQGSLAAYVTAAGEVPPAPASVRRWLRAHVPDYLVPSTVTLLDAIPLTPNGKLDYAALPEPRPETAPVPRPPATPLEATIGAVWREVLGRADGVVSTDEDFFSIGGHSLLATRVAARLSAALDRPVPLGLLFEHTTIAGLATALGADAQRVGSPVLRRDPDAMPPLSLDQERIWLRQQLHPSSAMFTLPLAVRLTGDLDTAALHGALVTVVARHEPLRCLIRMVDDEPRVVPVGRAPQLSIVDLQAMPNRAAVGEAVLREVAARPFDLADEPPLRACLVRLGATEHLLLVAVHHIAFDGASVALLTHELAQAYTAGRAGRAPELASLPVGYGDVARWQRERLAAGVHEASLAFWAEQLRGAPASLELPTDRPRPTVARNGCVTLPVRLGAPLSLAVARVAAAYEMTPFQVLLAAYALLLRRHTGQSDLVIGAPVSGRRDHPDLEPLIGCLVDMVPLRLRLPSAQPDADDLLRLVRAACGAAFSHADAPFERLVERVLPHRDLSRAPIFQTVFAVPFLPPAHELPGLQVTTHRLPSPGGQYELALFLGDDAGELAGVLEYDPDLFDRATIDELVADYAAILGSLTAGGPPRTAARPSVARGPRRATAHQSALAAVRAGTPASGGRTHVSDSDVELNAVDLWRRTAAVADALSRAGVRRGDIVAVCQSRSALLVPSVLGIWSAGAAYLPVDPDYPAARMEYMLADSGCRAVLADAGTAPRLAASGPPVLRMDLLAAAEPAADEPVGRDDAACLLYTSGSTGQPKGVVLRHGALANLLAAVTSRLGMGPDDNLLALTTISFDLALLELFGPLTVGAAVVVAGSDEARDPAAVARLAEATGATVLQATPTRWLMLLERGWRPRPGLRMLTGGEALTADLAARLLGDGRLWNLYAPTETTVYSTGEEVTDPDDVTIGPPLDNTDVYILDSELRPVPVGAVGEIFLGGAGVARGYHARPALTAQRFLPSPDVPGERLYRTGDLGRLRRDGRVVYLGRADHQVKVRGFRIEPGEVEAALRSCDGVQEAAVASHGNALVAYVSGTARVDELRDHLRTILPGHLVPDAFVVLPALPRTPNGKVDRRALPEPSPTEPTGAQAPPSSPVAAAITAAWADALGQPRLSPTTDVFAVGAHSLLAARVSARLGRELGREVPLRLLFTHPSAESLATALERAALAQRPAPRPTDAPATLSPMQERLWIGYQVDPTSAAYNMPLAVRLGGTLDVAAVHTALTSLVARHEALRTVITADDGVPHPRVLPPGPVALTVVTASRDVLPLLLRDLAYAPFDLGAAPPVRCALVRLAPDEHVLVAVVHHIVCDGWSGAVLASEFADLYAGRALPAVALRPADVASWQRSWLTAERLAAEESHWVQALERAPTALDLPTDKPRPPVATQHGASLPFDLGPDLTARVRRLAADHHATEFMVLLAALGIVLSGRTGSRDVLVGAPVAGRDHPDLAGVVAFLANTVTLRVQLHGDPTVADLLDRVRERCLDAFAHAEVPFERIVRRVRRDHDQSRTPLFQVMLALQQGFPAPPTVPGLALTPLLVDNPTAKYELVVSLTDDGTTARGFLEFNTDLFEAVTIERLGAALVTVLDRMAADPGARLSDLPLMPAAELARVVHEWNRGSLAYDPQVCLHELVARQARRTPDATAVIDDTTGTRLTYAELERASDRVAWALRDHGVGLDELVAVVVPRSAELVVGLYGALKAGAGFLPLDPDHPTQRMRDILDDAGVRAAVTTAALAGEVAVPATVLVSLQGEVAPPLPPAGSPGSIAYAIYTSGSTGRPKGVLVEHRAISNNLLWMQQDWPLRAHDRLLQKTTAAFDVAVKEVFWPLLAGAAVVLARPGGQRDPQYIAEAIERHQVTIAHFVPSMLAAALAYADRMGGHGDLGTSLEKVMSGAETLPAATLRRFHEQTKATLLHMYGPTETAIAVTGWTCPRDREISRVPLGRAMPDVQLYVLDRRGRPVPPGAWGELYVGGTAVGRGYLGRPAETAAVFVPDPFSGRPGARLYRTGDLARLGSDDLLEFGGRRDRQVKVHGFRVELGEVEAALARHPAVRQAAVVPLTGGAGVDGLLGYAAVEPSQVDPAELLGYLRHQIPEYMVPRRLVCLAGLPLNANGKVDYGRLPAIAEAGAPAAPAVRTPARTDTERRVAALVAAALGLPEVGLEDDIFDLGAHSLLVVNLATAIASELGVDLRLRDIFLTPTVAGIVAAVAAGTNQTPVTRADRAAYRRAAPTQREQPQPIRGGIDV